MDTLIKWIAHICGYFHIPLHLKHAKKHIIHISDTPSSTYKGLEKLFRELEPEIIIHTGDLVDEIKLEYQPRRYEEYEKKAEKLMTILENTGAKVYITLGNHDHPNIQKLAKSGRIQFIKNEILYLACGTLAMGHYPQKVKGKKADYHLYGHDMGESDPKPKALNGIHHVHIIHKDSGEIFKIPYPMGTDDQRMGYRKRGL